MLRLEVRKPKELNTTDLTDLEANKRVESFISGILTFVGVFCLRRFVTCNCYNFDRH
jgi:hypothetical protein